MSVITRNTRSIAVALAVVAILSVAPAAYADCESNFDDCMEGKRWQLFVAGLWGREASQRLHNEIAECHVDRILCILFGEGEQ